MMATLRKCVRYFLQNPRVIWTRPYSGSTAHVDPLNLKANEEEIILEFLNTCTMKELRGVDLFTNEQVTDLVRYRSVEGRFSKLASLPSLLQVDENTLRNIYSGLLTLSRAKTNTAILQKNFVPTLSLDDVKAFSSVTGLEICVDSIYFAHLKSSHELMSWNHISYPDINYRRQGPTQVFEMAHSLVRDLPDSDVYLLEQHDFTSQRSSIKNMQMKMFICQLQMSILHLLNKDFMSNCKHKVYFAKKNFVKRTFHLILGGEGVSGQHLVTNQDNEELPSNLQISPLQKFHFLNLQSDLEKERYTNTLLLPLAFLKLNDKT